MINEEQVRQAAKQDGGRHHGKYVDVMNWKAGSIRKAIKSYTQTINEHIDKLENPEVYDEGWHQKDERAKEGLLKKWRKDLSRNLEERIVVEMAAKERGIKL